MSHKWPLLQTTATKVIGRDNRLERSHLLSHGDFSVVLPSSGTAPPPWNPNSIPNLWLWFDAEYGITEGSIPGNVVTWTPRINNTSTPAAYLNQSIAVNQPTIVPMENTKAVAGVSVVTAMTWNGAQNDFKWLHDGSAVTFIGLYKTYSNPSTAAYGCCTSSANLAQSGTVWYLANNRKIVFRINAAGSYYVNSIVTLISDSECYSLAVRYPTNGYYNIRKNRIQTDNAAVGTPSVANPSKMFSIGYSIAAGMMTLKISHMLYYKRILTDNEVQLVENWLLAKVNL